MQKKKQYDVINMHEGIFAANKVFKLDEEI